VEFSFRKIGSSIINKGVKLAGAAIHAVKNRTVKRAGTINIGR